MLWHDRGQGIGKVGGLGLYSFHGANESVRKEREVYGVLEPSGICIGQDDHEQNILVLKIIQTLL